MDQDRNHDGKTDISVAYSNDKVVRTLLDTTGDGRFDTVQRHDDPAWSTVTEVDRDGDGRIDERLFYTGEIVRLKEGFHPETGVLVVRGPNTTKRAGSGFLRKPGMECSI